MDPASDCETAIEITACLIDCIADDDGTINQAQFDKICNAMVKLFLSSGKVSDSAFVFLTTIFSSWNYNWEPTEAWVADFKENLCGKIKNAFRLISKAVFCFFGECWDRVAAADTRSDVIVGCTDADGNGTVSKEAMMAILRMILKLSDPAYCNLPLPERLNSITQAFFRVFDSTGSGAIEILEAKELAEQILGALCNLLTTLIDYFKPMILEGPQKWFVDIYCDKLYEQIGHTPFPIDSVVQFNVQPVKNVETSSTLNGRVDSAKQLLESLYSNWNPSGSVMAELFKQFESKAVDGKLNKADGVDIATASLCDALDAICSSQVVATAVPTSLVNEVLSQPPLPGLNSAILSDDMIIDFINSVVLALRTYFRGGGLKRYLGCVFDLLDVNNDSVLSMDELRFLIQSTLDTYSHGVQPGLSDKLATNQKALYGLMHADHDDHLTRAEILTFATKLTEFVFAAVNLANCTLKSVLTSTMLPLVSILFSVKAQMLGGSVDSLTSDDIALLFAKIEANRLEWSDKATVIEKLRWDGSQLSQASAELRADREVVLVAVGASGMALQHASDELRRDNEVVLVAVSSDGAALQYASDELRGDREFMLYAVASSGKALELATFALKDDREVVLAAVRRSGCTLAHASDALRSDREIVLAAVSGDGNALEYASDALRADREVVQAAVGVRGTALRYVGVELRRDPETVLAAVTNSYDALEFASDELKADISFLRQAIAVDGAALQFAADEIRGDKALAMEVISHSAYVLKFVADELRGDKEVVLLAVTQCGTVLSLAAPDLANDREVAMAAVAQNPYSFQYVSDQLKSDKELCLLAVPQIFGGFAMVSEQLQNDRDFVLQVISRNGALMSEVPDQFKGDLEIVLAALRTSCSAVASASEALRDDEEAVKACLEVEPSSLSWVSERLRADKAMVLLGVAGNGNSLHDASEELKGDKEVVLAAVRHSGYALQTLSRGTGKSCSKHCCRTGLCWTVPRRSSWPTAGWWRQQSGATDPNCRWLRSRSVRIERP